MDGTWQPYPLACPCRKRKCERHGYCEACDAYHRAKGKRPYCVRKQATMPLDSAGGIASGGKSGAAGSLRTGRRRV